MSVSSSFSIDVTPWVRNSSSGVGLATWYSFLALKKLDSRAQAVSRVRGSKYRWIHPIERLMGKKSSLYHSFEHRMSPFIKATRVLSIHDLWTLKEGNLWQTAAFQKRQAPLLKQAIRKAHWITTPSRSVLRELHTLFPETRDHSQCVPWGVTLNLHPQPEIKPSCRPIDRPYFLTVANFEARKNLSFITRALQDLSGFDWVFAGNLGHGSQEIVENLQNFALTSKIRFHFHENLSSTQLINFYRHCEAVVLPSHDEGFGLPALEAAALARPLILSNIAPFQEIAIEGALYFDPIHGVEALRGHILRVLEDSSFARKLGAQSLVRSQLFTWEKTASAFLEIYRKLEPNQ